MKTIKYIKLLGLILMLVILNSCKKSVKDIESDFLKDAVSKIKLEEPIKWVVILPGLGCNGCIQEAEAFMKDHIDSNEVLFVLTNISSLKILEQKINIKIKEHSNIFIDRDNRFILPTDNSIYPCIIQIKNKKILRHEFQCPMNNQAFWKIKNLILSKRI